MRLDDTVVIHRSRGLGINAAPAARTAGASAVIVIDMIADRLIVACDFGGTHYTDPSGLTPRELTERVRSRTDGIGTAEVHADFESVSTGTVPKGALVP